MADSFRNQVVLITGASQGIGKALALQLAPEGARLVLASRDKAALDALAEECVARGASALAVPGDLAEPDACRALVETATGAFGELHMLINNAGISMYAPFAAARRPARKATEPTA